MKPASTPLKNLMDGYNYALKFAGVGDYVSLPAAVEAALNGATWTIAGWMQASDLANSRYVIGPASVNHARTISRISGSIAFAEEGISGALVSWPAAIGETLHFAVTYDGANLRAYKNGVLVAGPTAYAFNGSYAGVASVSDSHSANSLKGLVDRLRVYSRALSAVEAAQQAQGVYLNETGLVARYEFDESTGSTAYDWSPNAYNGTLTGGPTYLNGGLVQRNLAFVHADLYTFTLADGTVARFTSADRDLTIGGNLFTSANGLFTRDKTFSQLGLRVATLKVTVSPRATDTIDGVSWMQAALQGNLDWADVLVERFLSDSWQSLGLGTLYQFRGKVGGIDIDGVKLIITVPSPLKVLVNKMPRNMWQPTCVNTLYDASCTLVRGSFTVAAACQAGSTTSTVNTNLTQANGYFALGSIVFTSGVNAGSRRSIDTYFSSGGQVNITVPLPQAPAGGDTFNIYPGCNKVESGDCTTKFNNVPNFRGAPDIPTAETAV